MEGSREFDDAPTSNTQATNWQNFSQVRGMMSNMYPTTQQPGSTTIPQPNMITALDQDMPPNHILLAILSTVFCICPCGVLSLCHAVQVNDNFLRGNTAAAQYNSRQAWRWGITSISVGCLVITIVLIYFMVLLTLRF